MTRHASLAAETRAAPIDRRVDEILVQARHAFVEKGFDGASMQDLARAAGMSAGNFYRYFNSKSAIVEALVTRDLDEVEAEFTEILGSSDPIGALRGVIRRRLAADCDKDLPLWAEIMAAAGRKPEIAAACGRMEADIVAKVIHVLSIGCGLSPAEGAARFTTPARFILLLIRSAAMQVGPDGPDPALNTLILDTIDRLIDETTAGSLPVPPR